MPRSLPPSSPDLAPPSSGATAPVLRADGVSISFDGRPVLTDVSVAVDPGHRVGLVGENGSGKSTLLGILAGDLEPDVGAVHRPPDLGLLRQELPLTTRTTVADLLDEALTQVRGLAAAVERAGLALADPTADDDAATQAYDLALRRAELAEAWDVDHRLELLLDGLDVAALPRGRRLLDLSGGERTRLSLAALLVRRPAALLLDEPTNHLDDDAAEFLATQLRALPGAVLLASHDRVLLDEVCTGILDLDPTPGGPVLTRGSYADHRREQQVRREQWEQRYAAEQDELAALRGAVTGVARRVAPGRAATDGDKALYEFKAGRVQHQLSRRVRNARRRLDELEADQVRRPPPRLTFRVPEGTRVPAGSAGLVVWLRDVVVPGRVRADRLEVAAGRPLLVTGPNGSGKSTLLAVLAGDLGPARGTVQRRRGVEVALLEQDVHLAGEERSPRELYALATAGLPDPPRLVELGLLAPRDVDRPVGTLSVGQRRRVVLAMVVARRPGLLLLDEPTNHISLALADELQDALQTAPGAVVVASHDRWVRRRWVGEHVEVRDGQLVR